jgi:ketosteroid isomerase-like protein
MMQWRRRLEPMRRLEIGLVIVGWLIPVVAMAATPAASGALDPAAARAALMEADRAFSRLSQEQGMRAAFLAYLAEDAVLFRPGPVAGRAFIEARPSPAIVLTWRPSFAEVAASGDLGYTTGPYELRATGTGERPAEEHGYYVTVWRQQADGNWKVIADLGVTTPPSAGAETDAGAGDGGRTGASAGGATGTGAGAPAVGEGRPADAASSAPAARDKLLAADRGFAGDAIVHGARAAYMPLLADDCRLYREGEPPAVGREAAGRTLAAGKQLASSWEPVAAAASRDGDLGFAYGNMAIMAGGAPRRIQQSGVYFRIWRRQHGGPWRIALDVVHLLPAAAGH